MVNDNISLTEIETAIMRVFVEAYARNKSDESLLSNSFAVSTLESLASKIRSTMVNGGWERP